LGDEQAGRGVYETARIGDGEKGADEGDIHSSCMSIYRANRNSYSFFLCEAAS